MRNAGLFLMLLGALFLAILLTNTARGETTIDVLINSRVLKLNEDGKMLMSVPIATPRVRPKEATAEIVSIEENPWWHPTGPTREAYFRRTKKTLPGAIAPGDSRNAMGKVKFNLRFTSGSMNSAVKFHGTNEAHSIGQAVSRGCFRLRNDDALALAKLIKEKFQKKETIIVRFILA